MKRHVALFAVSLLLATLIAGAEPGTSADRRLPWFGMGVRPQRNQKSANLALLVERTVSRGPADRAGIQPGDLIVRIGGEQIRFADTLEMLLFISERKPGERMLFSVVRRGAEKNMVLVVGTLSESRRASWERALQIARQERILTQRTRK